MNIEVLLYEDAVLCKGETIPVYACSQGACNGKSRSIKFENDNKEEDDNSFIIIDKAA